MSYGHICVQACECREIREICAVIGPVGGASTVHSVIT